MLSSDCFMVLKRHKNVKLCTYFILCILFHTRMRKMEDNQHVLRTVYETYLPSSVSVCVVRLVGKAN